MIHFFEEGRLKKFGVWIQEGLFFVVCFFYLLLQIHPVLILESQPPVFLKGTDFLSEFLKIPGGLTDWLSALFMQFWFSDFLSALFLTVCCWLVAFLTRKWIEILTGGRRIHTFHLIPAGLLLILHSQYDFHLSITLALIINLSFLILFVRWAPKRQAIRAALGLVITVLLYWTTGGAFYMFAILCGVGDLFLERQITNGLLLLIVSIVLPIAASASVFLVTQRQAFLHNQVFEDLTKLWIVECSIPVFYLLALVIALLSKFAMIQKSLKRVFGFPYIWKLGAGLLLLLGGTILLEQELCDNTMRTMRLVLQVNRSVRESRWSDVLKSVQQHPGVVDPLLLYQTNLSLYQMGILPDGMFTYPQILGTVGLLMDYQWCTAWPEEASNVYWRLGLLSESEHWAHEALEYKGYTPDLLRRLGMVYMVKGNNEAANHFFRNLEDVPFQRKTAENLIRLNTNPSELAQDSAFKYTQSCEPVENFVYRGGPSSAQLELLLRRNSRNKMAFEYLMAYYLLDGDLKEIWNNVSDFDTLGYAQIPLHVQEALIFYAALTPKFDLNQLKGRVSTITFKNFLEFRQIFLKYQGNKKVAGPYLQERFGDTYWYYYMFVKPTPNQSEDQE